MDKNYNELWMEIDKIVEVQHSKKLVHERSIHELANAWGMSDDKAEKLANELVSQGKLASREALSKNGKKTRVYFPLSVQ